MDLRYAIRWCTICSCELQMNWTIMQVYWKFYTIKCKTFRLSHVHIFHVGSVHALLMIQEVYRGECVFIQVPAKFFTNACIAHTSNTNINDYILQSLICKKSLVAKRNFIMKPKTSPNDDKLFTSYIMASEAKNWTLSLPLHMESDNRVKFQQFYGKCANCSGLENGICVQFYGI